MARRNKKAPNSATAVRLADDPVVGSREAMESARYLRLVVTIAASILTMTFGWLKFRGVDVLGVMRTLPADFVLKAAMAIYFASWIAGLLSDLADMEFVLVKSPSPTHVKVGGTLLGSMTAVAFGVLCTVETIQQFSIALLALLIVNTAGWFYLTRVVIPPAEQRSSRLYASRGQMLRLEQLKVVCTRFQRATWQFVRLLLGMCLAACMIFLAHKHAYLELKIELFKRYGDILSAGIFLGYVLLFEGWIWFMRMRVKGSLSLLLDIERHYELKERAA